MEQKRIKILQINYNDQKGGAAKLAMRLNLFINTFSTYSSRLLVRNKFSKQANILFSFNFFYRFIIKFIALLEKHLLSKLLIHKKEPFSLSLRSFNPGFHKLIKKFDLVHLHWINNSFISIGFISKISKPVIWTFHDAWPFTGGCHIFNDCINYTNGCNSCPKIKSNKDLTKLVIDTKKKWNFSSINVVCPSNWLAEKAKSSLLFKNNIIKVINNGIDINTFTPYDRNVSRKELNLPEDKFLVLFGAVNAIGDYNKGFDLFMKAIQSLNSNNIEILVFGSSEESFKNNSNIKFHFLGDIMDENTLAKVYSSSDVFVNASRSENFPTTILEAGACGVPTVAFNVGGIPEIIEHNFNGYLVKPFDVIDFAKGIIFIKNLNDNNFQRVKINSRSRIVERFNIELMTEKYLTLYNEVYYKTL
jgi:glycosyltransferase involved in cell wall biosynthesis